MTGRKRASSGTTVPIQIAFGEYSAHVPTAIPTAVTQATNRFLGNRQARVDEMPNWEDLRQSASDIRLHTLDHLDHYLEQLEQAVESAGGHVHWAADAAQAVSTVLEIARQHEVNLAVKVKSMATEEIGLNHALQAAGIQVYETDLGEFIIQLAGTGPSHIIVPAIHLKKEEIADLFRAKLGVQAPPDPEKLAAIARETLREKFLSAEMGISGANFLVAESGTLVIVTNEGNGRMCTTLPDLHVAVVGIDKVVPDWESLAVLLKLLPRSATGQKLSAYTSFITGPRRAQGEFGPAEFHLVLLDNGRRRVLQDPLGREVLKCIRCGCCVNVCPVYKNVGGFAYGWFISGPIGAIFTPQVLGTQAARELPFASSLCGACADVCPVKIPIPQILLHLRHRVVEGDDSALPSVPVSIRRAARLSRVTLGVPWLYSLGARLLPYLQAPFRKPKTGAWLPSLPAPLNRWTDVRPMPAFQAGFRPWWAKRDKADSVPGIKPPGGSHSLEQPTARIPEQRPSAPPPRTAGSPDAEIDLLLQEINALSGSARRVDEDNLDATLQNLVQEQNIHTAALWSTPGLARLRIEGRLRNLGVEIVSAGSFSGQAGKRALAKCDLGVTEVDFALPETGTIGLLSSTEKPRAISLLPRVHLAIIQPGALRADLHEVFAETRQATHTQARHYLVFITGPSRTADIELIQTLGVHGPKALYAWVLTTGSAAGPTAGITDPETGGG